YGTAPRGPAQGTPGQRYPRARLGYREVRLKERMKTPNGKISVVLAIYNVAPYLRQCLNSIVNQTYRNLEIICVDDGSTDESGSICDEYAAQDARVHVIHQKNQGEPFARNAGLDTISGDYVYFADG